MSAAIRLDVVIPAGTILEGEYRAAANTIHRALAPVGDDKTPVLQIVVDALRGSQSIGKIIVVGNETLVSRITNVDIWIASQNSGPANILAGLKEVSKDKAALVCTSDLPFISTDAIDRFIREIDPSVDIAVGVVDAMAYNACYSDAPPSEFVGLNDYGPVTIGGLFYVKPIILDRNKDLLERAFSARKRQWQMAALLGPRLVCQFAVRKLTMRAIIGRAEHMLKCQVGIVRDTAPELAFDIDTVDDYHYARTHAGREPGRRDAH